MTQEELDALMNGGIDDLEEAEENIEESSDVKELEEEAKQESQEDEEEKVVYPKEVVDKLPLPATDENKMVHQLDDVTKESEEKASEIFDIIESVSNDLMDREENLDNITQTLNSNVELFEKLNAKFPDVEAFSTQLEKNQNALQDADEILQTLQSSGDAIMNVMDIMQYQDIHRQKIERVINVMRALSRYMNTLFEGKIEDEKRVSSATHIHGDTHTDTVDADDIEALLEQFGQK